MRTFVAAGLVALTAAPVVAQNDIILRYGTVSPERTFLADVDQAFFDGVYERTNGVVSFQPFWSGSVGGQGEIVPLIVGGGVDIGAVSTGYQFGTFTLTGLTNAVPATFSSEEALEITADLFANNEAIRTELDALNLHPVMIRHFPEYRLLCTEPLTTMSEFEGRRIRAYGPFVSRMFEALGAIPVAMESTEQYEALQRGVIDCAFWNPSLMRLLRLDEVAPHLSDLEFGAINAYTMFTSKTVWDSWPEEVQQAVEETAADVRQVSLDVMAQADEDAIAAMTEGGVTLVEFTEPEAFQDALPDMLGIWLAEVEAARPEILPEAEALVESVRAQLSDES